MVGAYKNNILGFQVGQVYLFTVPELCIYNVYNDYVPDAKPWTVEAETRALADVCLLLFNSNEFMYVY